MSAKTTEYKNTNSFYFHRVNLELRAQPNPGSNMATSGKLSMFHDVEEIVIDNFSPLHVVI